MDGCSIMVEIVRRKFIYTQREREREVSTESDADKVN